MRTRLALLAIVASASAWTAPDARALEASVFLGPNSTTQSLSVPSTPTTVSSKMGFVYGVSGGVDIWGPFAWDLGFFRTTRGNTQDYTALGVPHEDTIKIAYYEVPLMVRMHLPFISVAAGGYYDFAATGKGELTQSVGGVSLGTSEQDLADQSKSDIGFIGSAAFRMPIAPTLGLVVDLRYLVGLKNEQAAPNDGKWREFQFLLGANFSL